jgi:hypothetical protein
MVAEYVGRGGVSCSGYTFVGAFSFMRSIYCTFAVDVRSTLTICAANAD